MILSTIVQALGLFVVTNIDNIIILSLFFGRDHERPGATYRILIGQYIGFIGTLGAAVMAALTAQALLSERIFPYFGLIPIGLGLWAAWQSWRTHGEADDDTNTGSKRVSIWTVVIVTFANGGDNIGVSVPVFVSVSWDIILIYCTVFFILTPLMVFVAKWITSRTPVAKALDRWDDILFPTVLIGIGLFILVGGLTS